MSGMFSDYWANKLIDHGLAVTNYTPPTHIYVALFLARGTIEQACAGTDFVECAGGSYARVNVGVTSVNWNPAALRASDNKLAVPFPTPTADWGTVVAIGYYDQLGNLLWWSDCAPRFCALAASVSLLAGSIDVSLPQGI